MIGHLKLFLSEIFHKGNYSNNSIIKELRTTGYVYIPDFLSEEEVNNVLLDFDNLFKDKDLVKLESNGLDRRIYGADKRGGFSFDKIEKYSAPLFKSFSYFTKPFHFLLLGWLLEGKENLGSGGGWHRDSPISHQFKTIIYLTDVTEENGPFQFIEGTQNWRNNLKVSRYLKEKLSKRRFSNEEVNNMISKEILPKVKTFTSKKGGLIIADTRGLHRGKPLVKGERKAITRYHFSKDIADKFFK